MLFDGRDSEAMNLLGMAVYSVFCLAVSFTEPDNKSIARGIFSLLNDASLLSNETCCAELIEVGLV